MMATKHERVQNRTGVVTKRDQSRKELGLDKQLNWLILIALMKEQINQQRLIWGRDAYDPLPSRGTDNAIAVA